MWIHLQKTSLMVLPLAGVLLGGCTAHERLHHDMRELHEEFHEHPHTMAQHEQFHDDLERLHEDAHRRGYDDDY
jgi:outer membrane biogenesis lipoprotein LolB